MMQPHEIRDRLSEYIAPRLARKFKLGEFDCCIFAADWVQSITGKDPMDGLRGTYSDEESAAVVFATAGGLLALIAARLESVGATEIPIAQAKPGDVVLGLCDGRECCGLWVGGCALMFVCGKLQPQPRRMLSKAWRAA